MKTTQAQKKPLGRSRLRVGRSRLETKRSRSLTNRSHSPNNQSRLNSEQPHLKKEQGQKTTNKRSILDLLLGIFFLCLLALLITEFSPNDVVNIVLTNSYLPLLLLTFFAFFFLSKFIFVNQRLAFCLVFNLLIILFFILQNLTFNYYLIIILSLAPLIWLIINQIEKRLL